MIFAPLEDDSRLKVMKFQYEQKLQEMQQRVQELEEQVETCRMESRNVSPPADRSARIPPSKQQFRADRQVYEAALAHLREENYREALVQFEKLTKDFPVSQLADNAIFWMAKIYLHKEEPGLAQIELKRLLKEYPRSERLAAAKKELGLIESSQSARSE